MQKICAILILSALVNLEALPQTKWSRPIPNSPGQLTRERRQFPFGEWIPLSQPCPTCRPLADPLDAGLRGENIGLTPPRPPTVTRQIHGEGNFFPQDESSILSVPPPPPSAIPRQPLTTVNGNFQNLQFSGFGQQFNNPLPVPTQQIFPQTQQVQFLPQPFLQNQHLLVNNNQQILPGLSTQNNVFRQENQGKQQINGGKVQNFNAQKIQENVVLEQNKRPGKQFSSKPAPFALPQQNQQQTLVQHQTFGGQQHSVNFANSILTPPPAPKNVTQDIVIPGLDKEEIQLLYVPVETLRQRGNFQEQLLSQQHQNIQFNNRPNGLQQPVSNHRPTEQPTTTLPKGHFVTQNGKAQEQTVNTVPVTTPQPFPSTANPSTVLLQHLSFQQTPQPFVSATPATPTIQPFSVTPSSASQKFSPFTPETTLSHLVTIPNAIQFSQADLEFGTTPKTVLNQGSFQGEIINGKSQFSGFKNTAFQNQDSRTLQQPKQENIQQQLFVNQQQPGTHQQNTVFLQEQQKEIAVQNNFPKQQLIDQQLVIQKQQEEQRLIQQQKENELQEQFLQKQRQQKELEAQRLLQQQRQKELEEQRLLQQKQRQKELEEQRLLQQRQKELEEQRLLQQQRQKELEEQRFLQQQRQKELEEQRFLQQQRQKELELQQQRQKELENQRRLRLQKQKELEEKQRLQQLKQREEEQRLLQFQQQHKELEQQRLIQQQQQEQDRLLQQQFLERQKQENLKKQQQLQFLQQQQQQQQQKQQTLAPNRHTLPPNDKLNFISQLEKESEPETNLVPHQPPLSVFFKGYNGEAKIVDVLRELRSSNTITVLDQYFEKMPKVFVGPAGLIPPAGYRKFDLPYLSNLETNRIERKIDRLPFFVAPLNFIPPPGYAKIPFPAPHVGSVVVSSESNPAMKVKSTETVTTLGSVQEDSGSFPVVGPELPGLINGLETETTTVKPTAFPSTPSLPQTTAQLRNRRPNNSVYRPQNRKPVSKTRVQTTTSKPEEEVTQPIQKAEAPKDSDSGLRKPFSRFFSRRRQQTTTTTETPIQSQQGRKSLENRHYSVDVHHNQKNANQILRNQHKNEILRETQNQEQRFENQFEHQAGAIDRTTPGGEETYEVRPTPDLYKVQPTGGALESEERRQESADYSDISLQSFEDGPLPTGSAKTITQELYRPNAIHLTGGEIGTKTFSNVDGIESSEKFQTGSFEKSSSSAGSSEVNPTVAFSGSTEDKEYSEERVSIQPTAVYGKQEVPTSETYYGTEAPVTDFTASVTVSGDHQTKGLLDSNDQYTSAFAEISKHHHIPGPTESSKRGHTKFSDVNPTPEISLNLQAPLSTEFSPQEYPQEGQVKPTQQSADFSSNKFSTTGASNEPHSTGLGGLINNEHNEGFSDIPSSQVSPTAPGATQEQYTGGFSVNAQVQNTGNVNGNTEDQRIGSFISFHNVHSTANSPVSPQVQYFPSSTAAPTQEYITVTEGVNNDYSKVYEQGHVSSTPETRAEITVNPSPETYKSESASEASVQINEEKQTTEGQNVADNLSNEHRLKLPNPSIVRVRTRVRGKSRGQVNFAASQSTTPSPIVRSKAENTEQESSTKASYFRDYQAVKTSKFNPHRGLKKASRPTTEATTEYEQKANVYTIRPHRRPSSPSTVSTKRIRRPTTPIPSVESATEAFSISTSAPYSENSDFAPSGVSNDVYYEHTSLSPIRQKFRKFFGSAEQKSDVVPAFVSTVNPSTVASHQDSYSEEANIVKDLSQTVPQDNSDRYPEWNPSESGLDVSGIVLTTTRTPDQEDHQEVEEPKKIQDNKKAFDPDLEKKSGRRRVRVRVHKRPHENFETAESQNLRTVANVLVPPTTTYKPIDDSGIHQLAKNSDFSFGGQKLFGLRSREYFRKRLNLTETENADSKRGGIAKQEEAQGEIKTGDDSETKISGFVRKAEKIHKIEGEGVSGPSGEGVEGVKITRPKFRGYVRKIVKHGRPHKEAESESNQSSEVEESGEQQESVEHHPKIKINHGGFNHTGRFNGTRHRTFVRYVKKNKIRPHEIESHQETSSEEGHKEEQSLHQTTEFNTQTSENQQPTEEATEEKLPEQRYPVYYSTQQTETTSSPTTTVSEPEPTELPEIKQTTLPAETAQPEEIQETSSPKLPESNSHQATQEETSVTQQGGLYLTQKPKFYQTLRPVFPRTSYSGFQRTREPGSFFSTTEQASEEVQEKRDGPIRTRYYSKGEQTLEEVQEKRDGPIRPKFYPRGEQSGSDAQEKRERPVRPKFFPKTEQSSNNAEEKRDGPVRPKFFPKTEQSGNNAEEKRDGPIRHKYGKTTGYGATSAEKSEETKKGYEIKNKNQHTLEVRKYLRSKNREGLFSQFSKNRFSTSEKTETRDQSNEERESEEITTPVEKEIIETKNEYSKTESTSIEAEPKTTQTFITETDSTEIGETTKNEEDSELHITTTEVYPNSSEEEEEASEESSEEHAEKEATTSVKLETTTEIKTEIPTTIFQASSSEAPQTVTELKTEEAITERITTHHTEIQPDLYRFSKSSFSFDETEKFTGTKNRAHVRNITTDIIESTASFSAPGVEKRTDTVVVQQTPNNDDTPATTTESRIALTQKTEETTADSNPAEATTDYPETTEIETTVVTEAVTKAKIAKLIKTSTTTKVSHETEICYKGKCIRTKNENPDEDLKLLVDSASTMKIPKNKT